MCAGGNSVAAGSSEPGPPSRSLTRLLRLRLSSRLILLFCSFAASVPLLVLPVFFRFLGGGGGGGLAGGGGGDGGGHYFDPPPPRHASEATASSSAPAPTGRHGVSVSSSVSGGATKGVGSSNAMPSAGGDGAAEEAPSSSTEHHQATESSSRRLRHRHRHRRREVADSASSSSRCEGVRDAFPGNRTCSFSNVWLGPEDASRPTGLGGRFFSFFSGFAGGGVNCTGRRPEEGCNDGDPPPPSGEVLFLHQRWSRAFRLEISNVDDAGPAAAFANGTAAASGRRPASSPPGRHPSIDDRCLVLIDKFHSNPGHNLWDVMYPSWAGLLAVEPEIALGGAFQWITVTGGTGLQRSWPMELVETFSGHPVQSLRDLMAEYGVGGGDGVGGDGNEGKEKEKASPRNRLLKLGCLVVGSSGRGISAVGKDGTVELGPSPAAAKGAPPSLQDPVRAFRDRLYRTHGLRPPPPLTSVRGKKLTVVSSKRALRGAAEAAGPVAARFGMNLTSTRWEDLGTFREQLRLCSETAVLVAGVGTVRTNTFLLPDGAAEVQTCDPLPSADPASPPPLLVSTNGGPPNLAAGASAGVVVDDFDITGYRRTCFDAHIGTLVSHVRVVHPRDDYSENEREGRRVPASFGRTLTGAVESIPVSVPVDRRDNLPPEVRRLYGPLMDEVPELFYARSGWCTKSTKRLRRRGRGYEKEDAGNDDDAGFADDCPPGVERCKVTGRSNDLQRVMTLKRTDWAVRGAGGGNGGCLPKEIYEKARGALDRLRGEKTTGDDGAGASGAGGGGGDGPTEIAVRSNKEADNVLNVLTGGGGIGRAVVVST